MAATTDKDKTHILINRNKTVIKNLYLIYIRMGNASSTFGLRAFDSTYTGADNGKAVLCVNQESVEVIDVTWIDGPSTSPGTILKGPTTYNGVTGDQSDVLENLSPGDYHIQCDISGSAITSTEIKDFTINELEGQVNCTPLIVKAKIEDRVNAKALVKDSTGELTYVWKKMNGKIISSEKTIKNLKVGVYVLEVTDENRNQGFDCFEITKWLPKNPSKLKQSKVVRIKI